MKKDFSRQPKLIWEVCHEDQRSQRTKRESQNHKNRCLKTIKTGAVNDEIVVELSGGSEIVSIITKSSAESLGLAPGKEVYTIIKASNVMIGVD